MLERLSFGRPTLTPMSVRTSVSGAAWTNVSPISTEDRPTCEGRGLAAPLVALHRHRAALLVEAGNREGARAALLKATALGIEINDQTRHRQEPSSTRWNAPASCARQRLAFYDMGDAATGLAFAKGAANALQSARQALVGLPQDMQGCFRDAIADQYRALAGLATIQAGQLTEAQEILTQLADF